MKSDPTLPGRVAIMILCVWGGGVLLNCYIFMASPWKDSFGAAEGPIAIAMLMGFVLLGSILSRPDDNEENDPDA